MSAVFAMFMSYLTPINGIIGIMVLIIIVDMIFGCIASFKKGDGIKSRKLWRTAYKIFYAVLIVSLLYALDKEMGQIPLHKTVAWLISGFEVWSILENLSNMTKLKVFSILKHFMEDKVKNTTGVDLVEESKPSKK